MEGCPFYQITDVGGNRFWPILRNEKNVFLLMYRYRTTHTNLKTLKTFVTTSV